MRCEPWMNKDERSPEKIRQDRLRTLREEEAELVKRLEFIRTRIAEISG